MQKKKKNAKRRTIAFDAAKAAKMFKAGESVADIAVAMGYERGQGQNRTRAALVKAGVYTKGQAAPKVTNGTDKSKVLAMPVPKGPEAAMHEAYKFVQSRYGKLIGRQRTGWVEKLAGMLLAGVGAHGLQRVQSVELSGDLTALKRTAGAA